MCLNFKQREKMAIKLTTTRESNNYVKMLIYGSSGVGKTKLAATAPDPIIVSSEDRLMSLRGFKIPVVQVATPNDFEEAYTFIKDSGKCDKFKTVVIDSISDIAEKCLVDFKKSVKDPRQAYGNLNDFMMSIMKKFRDLSNKHVYFIAKAGVDKDGLTEMNSWFPLMPGKQLAMQLPYLFDLSIYMQTINTENGSERVLHTADNIQWRAKDHSGNLDAIEPVHLGERTLDLLFKKALGEPEPKEENPTTENLKKSLTKIKET